MRPVPIRVRLVAGFVLAMLVVLTAAGTFVSWRVRVDLDTSLNTQLARQGADLDRALTSAPADPARALSDVRTGEQLDQLLDADGTPVASAPGAEGLTLLPPRLLAAARTRPVRADLGNLLTGQDKRLRVLAFPVREGVAVTALRIGQRDEALRELIAQLVLANLAALGVAAAVGYRLATAALAPVDRYRARAQQITEGDDALRLDVPAAPDDEITRLGHTLNAMLTALAENAEKQRRFVADASHELRTPLSLLTTEVELALRRTRTPAEYEQTLRDVALDVARLSRLAERLLALEATTASAQAEADLAAAARRAARRGAAQGSAGSVDAPDAPLRVAATDGQLDTLLGNLVDNAVRHGAGAVTVQACIAGDCAVVRVLDDGASLTEDFLPHAVERFRRADRARTTEGSGLGLALVHELAVRLGGELRLCSGGVHHTYPPVRQATVPCAHPAAGTTASLLLPVLAPSLARRP